MPSLIATAINNSYVTIFTFHSLIAVKEQKYNHMSTTRIGDVRYKSAFIKKRSFFMNRIYR